MKPSKSEVLKYGLPGFLFAFTALPLYLSTPIIYEGISNLSLATIGIILMIVRFSDAITDPIVGKMLDKTSKHRFIRWLLPSMLILSVSFFFSYKPS
ncbi:MAG: hypothetical protein CBD16_08685 [Betaproteobacteria bacterium TMED156]|nr:MAG: hypothetical protein CBD16_08685 [Betaproteobacteria bacterium TMED156]